MVELTVKENSEHIDLERTVFIWWSVKDTSYFCIFPEGILYEKQLISKYNETLTAKTMSMNLNNDNMWYKEYIFDTNNLDKDKLMDLFMKNNTCLSELLHV